MDDNVLDVKNRKFIWETALMLPHSRNLVDSGIEELSEYFKISHREVEEVLPKSENLLADEWRKMKVNPRDANSVISFYNNTKIEIFELMDWHINRFDTGPLNYVCALEIAKERNAKKYLDYGSGIGSGIILFSKNGFEVTSADISDPLQDFIKYRSKKRNINVEFINLKQQKLKKDYYEVITCFDVLEHLVKPTKTIKELREALKEGGILILNNIKCPKHENKPMHISEVNLEKTLRSLGFNQLWVFQKKFKEVNKWAYVTVLEKVKRNFLYNKFFYIYDKFCPIWFSKSVKKSIGWSYSDN